MRKGRVSDGILTSSHLIPVASAPAIWRAPRLVCVPPKSAFAPHCHTLGSMSDVAIYRQEAVCAIDPRRPVRLTCIQPHIGALALPRTDVFYVLVARTRGGRFGGARRFGNSHAYLDTARYSDCRSPERHSGMPAP